jgi:uncharacterized protein YlxW (UPF0749 family)
MSSPASQTVRRYILTGAVTAITVTGALYGAGLKTRQEVKQVRSTTPSRQSHFDIKLQEKTAVTEASIEEKIAHLDTMKTKYLRQKQELQNRIDQLSARSQTPTNATQDQGR